MKNCKRHLERIYHALRSATLFVALGAACALFAVVDVPWAAEPEDAEDRDWHAEDRQDNDARDEDRDNDKDRDHAKDRGHDDRDGGARFAGPTSSQPLALTANDAFLVVANPDNNSVTFFDVRRDHFRRLAQIKVQKEPNGVAFLPDGRKAYAANTISGTVSVINTDIDDGKIKGSRIKIKKHIKVGTEPYGLALT